MAIVGNEFFDRGVGRMGGFGWAAQRSAECFASDPELGLSPLLLAGQGELRPDVAAQSNGVPLLGYDTTRRYVRAVRDAKPALALTIDYRPNYLPVLRALERVPIVVWVRDPRTPEDMTRIATLAVPGSAEQPAGIGAIDCTSLGPFVEEVAATGTRVVVASPAAELATAKVGPAYGLTMGDVEKSEVLASAWMLVNTSIHEGLPISFLEALHHATPVVSCQDPERITSRFGVYVGRWDGSGLDALGTFADAVQRLLDDARLRARLGEEGREWVRATHTREHFGSALAQLVRP